MSLSPSIRVGIFLTLSLFVTALRAQSPEVWNSTLYGEDWEPFPAATSFDSDKIVQDFSYAGYHRGERPIPDVTGPVFNVVTDFGADPTGANDSTIAIQNAIDAATVAGGGVVLLPAGTFHIAPPSGSSVALSLTGSNLVLRGAGADQTFLVGTSTDMRSKRLINVTGPSPFWSWNSGTSWAIASDLLGPAIEIPMEDVSPFSVGDWILIRTDVTADWVNEHNEPDWLGHESTIGGLRYYRQVLAIDEANKILTIDAPTRYAIKTRDNARVYLRNNAIAEVGMEDFSIGNVQHPGSNWGSNDYTDPAKSAYETHASYLIVWRNVRNSWMQRIKSFAPSGNQPTGAHMLSNGVLLTECRGVTVRECHFQRPQYGGGGGNGYMYRLGNSNECLIEDCIAEFSRHGLVFSQMAASGNVIRNCIDKDTGKSTGSTGNLNTSGKSSDHHMHFSHSNLIDVCTADSSWFQAAYRPFGSIPNHNLTAAHTVFWNTRCLSSPDGVAVHSQQSRYGYVIGTRGNVTSVRTSGHSSAKTDPVDHVEGLGEGSTLEPFSLSLDQRRRRLQLPKIEIEPSHELFFPDYSLRLPAEIKFGNSTDAPDGSSIEWAQVSGPASVVFDDATIAAPAVAFPEAGTYVLACTALGPDGLTGEGFEDRVEVTITIHPADIARIDLAPTDDAYVRGGAANENDNYGTANQLWLKEVGNPSYTRESFLRFDLASLDAVQIQEATLTLHALEDDTAATAELHLMADDDWSEGSITWANRPTTGSWLETWSPNPSFRQRFDLLDAVTQQVGGDNTLTLRLKVTNQSNSSTVFKFASKEHSNAELQPKLSLVTRRSNLGFEEWIGSFIELTPEQRGTGDDPEGDQSVNLREFFHASDPRASDAESVLAVKTDLEGNYLEFFLRERLPAEARLWVEFSPDMAADSWRLLPGVRMETVSAADGRRLMRARLLKPSAGVRQGFYRLQFAL